MAVEKMGSAKAQVLKLRLNSSAKTARKGNTAAAAKTVKNTRSSDTSYKVSLKSDRRHERVPANQPKNTVSNSEGRGIERASRLAALKKSIRSGSYHIETNILAESVLRAIIHDGGIKKFVDGA